MAVRPHPQVAAWPYGDESDELNRGDLVVLADQLDGLTRVLGVLEELVDRNRASHDLGHSGVLFLCQLPERLRGFIVDVHVESSTHRRLLSLCPVLAWSPPRANPENWRGC